MTYWIWVFNKPGDKRNGLYADIAVDSSGFVPRVAVSLTHNLYGATVCSKQHNNITKSMLPSKCYHKQLVYLTLELL